MLFGLLNRKERWSLSWKGWLLTLVLFASLASLFVLRVHPFLSVTQRVDTRFLAVEGWIDLDAMRAAAHEFTNGGYQMVFTTGGPVHGAGPGRNPYSTSASIGAGSLRAAGLPPSAIQMVPSFVKDRDRTYSAAIALRDWLVENKPAVKRLNVVTRGVHARRSRLLFQKAFGNNFEIGIIAVPDSGYDAEHWWRYSEGVKDIISEGAAYLYVRLFFWPDG